jgi:exosortase
MAKSQETITNNVFQKWVIGIFALLIYVPAFLWMWDRWFARDSYYSHGILIPFVTLYLIWLKRDILKKIPPQTSPWGLGLFFLGIAIHLLSALFRVYFVSGFSMILVVFGLILHFYGSKVLKEILFPVSFLVFMVPLPEVIIVNLSFRLKIFAAQLAVSTLNHMHIFCVQQGSTIIMRHATVVVEDVCSGLRSLITLLALSSLFAYWMKSSMLKKSILFLSAVPIAVITNVMRIIFLATVSEIWGTQVAGGPIHEASGFIVFTGAFCLLYAVQKMIE